METIPREPTVPEAKTKTETKKQEFRRRVREMMENKRKAKQYQLVMGAPDCDLHKTRDSYLRRGNLSVVQNINDLMTVRVALTKK